MNNNDNEKPLTLQEALDGLKEEADMLGAASAKISFEDGEWTYTIEVKRKSKIK